VQSDKNCKLDLSKELDVLSWQYNAASLSLQHYVRLADYLHLFSCALSMTLLVLPSVKLTIVSSEFNFSFNSAYPLVPLFILVAWLVQIYLDSKVSMNASWLDFLILKINSLFPAHKPPMEYSLLYRRFHAQVTHQTQETPTIWRIANKTPLAELKKAWVDSMDQFFQPQDLIEKIFYCLMVGIYFAAVIVGGRILYEQTSSYVMPIIYATVWVIEYWFVSLIRKKDAEAIKKFRATWISYYCKQGYETPMEVFHAQREAAYYNWLKRGKPQNDDWADWFQVE